MGSAHRFHTGWLLFAACATTVPPLAEAPIDVTVAHVPRAGKDATADAGGTPRSLLVEVFAVRTPPAGRSLEAVAIAIAAEQKPPFRATIDLPTGCRWLDADRAPSWSAMLGERLGGATVVVPPDIAALVATSRPHLPRFHLTNEGDVCRVRIDTQKTSGAAAQHLLVGAGLPTTGSCALFVPGPGGTNTGHVLVLTAAGTPDAAQLAAARGAAANVASTPILGAAQFQARIASAAIGEHNLRSALLAIAQRLRLPQSVDALLAADETRLAAIAAATATSDPDDPAAPWQFERAVWSALLPALQRDELPPGLRACLLRNFGALAGDATTLQYHLATSPDATTFARAVQEENTGDLASRDPVLRVRAHEWLGARGAAVPGYDPLAPVAARRAVLRQHAAAAAAGAGSPTSEAR